MKNKKIPVIIGALALVAVGAVIYYMNSGMAMDNEVEAYMPVRQDITDTIEETGEVSSKRVMTIYDNMGHRVKKLNVQIGDSVKKDDVLLEYDNTYDLQIEQLNAQLERISASYSESAKGADFESLSNLKLTINTITNSLEFAKSNLEKQQKLYDEGVISKLELDKTKLEVESLENQLESANNNYQLLAKGISSNVKKQYDAQTEEVVAGIKLLEKAKEDCIVKAEFDGVVTELNAVEGSMNTVGAAVVEVSDVSDLCLYVDLLADEAVKVNEGMSVVCVDDDENEILSGLRIDKIYPKAFSKLSDLGVEQKRIRTEVKLPKATDNLKLGMEMDVKIILSESKNALTVNKDDVFELEGKKYVTLFIDNTGRDVEVQTGIESGDLVEIISGIDDCHEILKQNK